RRPALASHRFLTVSARSPRAARVSKRSLSQNPPRLSAPLPVAARPSPLAQMLLEERQRTLPGQLRRPFVIARGGVVVEAVVGARVEVSLVGLAVRLQSGLVGRPAGVHAAVVLGVLQQ